MSEREEMLKTYLKNQTVVHKSLSSSGISFLTEDDIWTILQTELDLEYNEVIQARLTSAEILEIIYTHINRNGDALGKIVLDIDEDDIEWIPIASDGLEKATIRNSGQVWVIYKNDADPHPSIPHAHNYQQNLKLDLYSGDLYRKTKQVGKMNRKELAQLVTKIKSGFPNIKFQN